MLPKRYNPRTTEPRLQSFWQEDGTNHFDPEAEGPIYSIDTPPPTVSGRLHLGHVYSYSHADFIARFRRMRGDNVFYPMGYDDNGLPTERLVERQLGIRATDIGRQAYIAQCLQVSQEAEKDYQALWQRLGLSIDWRYTYRTIDDNSRHAAQLSFLDLRRKGLAYRKEAPTIWCPECRTAIAQAELDDLERESEFVTLRFPLSPGERGLGGEGFIPIATTRPELLPACVAIFVHPGDDRYRELVGGSAQVPIFGQRVPILADPAADPEKGTGAVMCCTFGDTTDVAWWHTHNLPLVEAIDRQGRMTAAAGPISNLQLPIARQKIVRILDENGFISNREPTTQSVRVHERCDTPVEYIITGQWFIRVLDFKDELLAAGEKVNWHPAHMQARYRAWVENLNWDWCISRQRYYGVPYPVWYCAECGEPILADEAQLPVDPLEDQPGQPCPKCGGVDFTPEADVMDTWATSSLSPQIVSRWLTDPALYERLFPMSLRPQAHEIIRTWAFYTIAKSHFHFDQLPWKDALISGWGIAGEGMGKISKSRGGGPMPPMEMLDLYSADAVRYWTASTGTGKDAIISEEKIQTGVKLVTKLWNVARFSSRFLGDFTLRSSITNLQLSAADKWILSRTQRLIQRATSLFDDYEYATAKAETEVFFWHFADNYLEMAKQRLYGESNPGHEGACFTLYHVLLTMIKLFAPILPHVTERIYQGIFAASDKESIHRSQWPEADETLIDEKAEATGETLVEIATAVRRYKSEHNLSLGFEIPRLQLTAGDAELAQSLGEAIPDLMSITRARKIEITERLDSHLEITQVNGCLSVAIEPTFEYTQ
ncbi:MAG: valine--tRNA ligase [Chloroflexota bacterium]